MTKKKPKKPTLNEVKQVAENLLHDLQIVNNKVDSLALVVNTYIEYKKDEDDFMKHMKEQWEKIVINKELLIKILSENSWGLYSTTSPLEEMSSNVGKMYKISDVDADRLVDTYNAHFESPEE